MDLIYLVRILLNRLPILVAIPFVAAVVTAVSVFLSPKEYISEARVSTGYTITNRYSLYEERFNPVKSDLKFNNLIANIKSPVIVGTLSYRLLLSDLTGETTFSPILKEKEENWIEENYGLSKDTVIAILRRKALAFELLSSFDTVEKKVIKMSWDFGYSPLALRQSLSVFRINYTDYLSLRFRSVNPFFSALAVNTLCSEFVRYYNEQEIKKSFESIQFLDTLVREKKRNLEDKTNKLRVYKLSNNLLNFQIESTAKLAQVKDAEIEREKVLNNLKRFNLSIASIDERLSEQGLETEEMVQLRGVLTKLNQKRRNGIGNYAQLSDSISLVQNKLEYIIYNSPQADRELIDQRHTFFIEQKIEEDKLAAVDDRLAQLRNQVASFASTEATVSSMQQELDIAKEEYLMIQEKLNAAINSNVESKDNLKIEVRGQPALAHQPSGLVLKSGFTFLITLILCSVVIISLEVLDPRVKNIHRYEQAFNVPLLGTILETEKIPFFNALNEKKKKSSENLNLSLSSEMQKIRRVIISSGKKIFLFTSLKNGEGKTIALHTLAHSLASIGKNVLIIDTNFQSVHAFDKLDKENYTAETWDVNAMLPGTNESVKTSDPTTVFSNEMMVNQSVGSVKIMINNQPGSSPSEIFAKRDFSSLLSKFNESVDFIFIEGSALSNNFDSLELTDYADGVVFVVNARKAIYSGEKRKMEDPDLFEGKLLGAILNRASEKI
ncbi:MAG: hypothetical protein AAGA66_10935 [Bacteroidota bacterium]